MFISGAIVFQTIDGIEVVQEEEGMYSGVTDYILPNIGILMSNIAETGADKQPAGLFT